MASSSAQAAEVEDLIVGNELIGNDDLKDDDDEEGSETPLSSRDALFYAIVGSLEEKIMEPSFRDGVTIFCRKHCHEFDASSGENKLIYTSLFEEYSEMIETAIDSTIQSAFPGTTLESFESLMMEHTDELNGDVFDVLMSLGDFEEFKSLMVSYREQVDYEERQGSSHSTRGVDGLRAGIRVTGTDGTSHTRGGIVAPTVIAVASSGVPTHGLIQTSARESHSRSVPAAAVGEWTPEPVDCGFAGLSISGSGLRIPASPMLMPSTSGFETLGSTSTSVSSKDAKTSARKR